MAKVTELIPSKKQSTSAYDWVLGDASAGIARATIIDGSTGAETSGETILKNSRSVASALLSRGFEAETVVAVALPNLPVVAEIALGVFSSGCTLAFLNPMLPPEVFAQKLEEMDARLLVTLVGLPSADLRDSLRETVVIGGGEGCTTYEEFLSEPAVQDIPVIDPHSVAVIYQSSGTTSPSKPVELTHANVVAGLETIDERMKMNSADTALAVAPFFHVMGSYIMLLIPLRRGAKVVTVARPAMDEILEIIDDQKISTMVGSPPMMPAIAGAAAGGRLKSLQKIYAGGAPLDFRTESALLELFPQATVGQGYGLTEFLPVAVIGVGNGHPVGSVGKVVGGTILKIVDPDDGHECGVGEMGEIVVKGPQMMKGYRGRPEATSRVIDADGWLHTADLGHVDDEGFLFLTGRLTEMIAIQGRRVAPKTFEDVVLQNDLVREVVAAGIGEDPENQVPVLFVVGDERLTVDEVRPALMSQLPDIPECEIVLVDAIPKSPAGKILRTELLEGLTDRSMVN